MKTFLTFSALIIAVGYPSIALAESSGVHLPNFLNTTTIITSFCVVCLGLLAYGDYARTQRLTARSLAKGSLNGGRRERHRLAA
jgi:hypothetical protein